jgi:hypothetical protein
VNLNQFVAAYNKKWKDFDGAYGAQCVDLFDFYLHDVWAIPIYLAPGAVDLFGGRPQLIVWTQIRWGDTSQYPQRGDVIIWGANAKVGTGVFGHVGIVTRADGYTFDSFDQNWPLNAACHIVHHTYDGVRGWGHHKTAPAPSRPPQHPRTMYTVAAVDGMTLGPFAGLEVAQLAASKYASEHRDVDVTVIDQNQKPAWSIVVPSYHLFEFRTDPEDDLRPITQATTLADAMDLASAYAIEHPQSSIEVFKLLPSPTGDDRGATEALVYTRRPGMVPAIGSTDTMPPLSGRIRGL